MHDRFRIACGLELVTLGQQVFADFFVVVYFTVENDPGTFVRIGNWLLAGAQVDNAQSRHAKGGGVYDDGARFVRTAMVYRLAHTADQLF